MQHVDDHVLEINHLGQPNVWCPLALTPAKRRGKCGWLEHCGCEADYVLARDKMEFYFDLELGSYDWIDGYTAEDPLVSRLAGDSHKACPRVPGQSHYTWEGEIMVPGTECGYAGEIEAVGADLYGDVLKRAGHDPAELGRYAFKITWPGEYEAEFELLEKVG